MPAKPISEPAEATKVSVSPEIEPIQKSVPEAVEDVAIQEPLILLNNEVEPGTSTRLGWTPGASFIGIAAPTAVLAINGVSPGPTLCLTAAVHGDELNGVEIVRRLLYDIDPEKLSGEIIGVPIVNLQGFRRGSRYLPDRRDLNRFFPGNPEGSSASRIAFSFFSEIVSSCDMLIDLHTGSFRRTNLPQLRADLNYPEVAKLAEKMGAIVVVQSEGAPGSLRRAAVEAGIPAVTLEAGAPHELDKAAIEHGVKSIESALDSLSMIKRRRFWEREAEPIYYESSWVRAKDGGILFSEVVLGASVLEGDLLGTVTDPITNRHSEIRAPFAGQIIGMALNQVMFPGFAAYHLGHMPAPGNESVHVPAPLENGAVSNGVNAPATNVGDHGADDSDPSNEISLDMLPIEDSE
ncbi:MAG: succinylglutamate desuccinylase/aspartoacylase family protein [Agarilytica sp.]